MNKFYTKDYTGQLISTRTNWKQNKKDVEEIWIDKSVENDQHHGVAHIIGNGESRLKLKLDLLNGQTGGSQGVRNVGQTYGCNLLYKDWNPTFLIVMNADLSKEIANSDYCDNNIVYSSVKNVLVNPGKFHIYPDNTGGNVGALALKLACADNHKKIFMIGFDFMMTPTDNVYIYEDQEYHPQYLPNNNYLNSNLGWAKSLYTIMQTYDDVEFFSVVEFSKAEFPEEFKMLRNFKQINMRSYYNLASLGAVTGSIT